MKLIAHRGNIKGTNSSQENCPEYVESAINDGFDVEVDIWYDRFDNKFYLGHDSPQYATTWGWLAKNIAHLWIHCKNIEALYEFSHATSGYNYFWHQEDDFTLTSKSFIWTYPGKSYTPRSVIVMPEWNMPVETFSDLRAFNCHGICSDYVGQLK